jgi:putative ABC transport system substrate-binding protein
MTSRREFIVGTAMALGGVTVASAQSDRKLPKVGYVGNASPTLEESLVDGFRRGLRERGYVEGRDIEVVYRWAEGRSDALPVIINDLIAQQVNVLITAGTPSALAAKKATTSVPIVMAAVGDAVGSNIVASLARPGGNMTGLSTLYPQLEGKRMQILRELMPKLKRIALLSNPANPFTPLITRSARAAIEAQGWSARMFEVSAVADFDSAFTAIASAKVDAMAVLADRPFLVSNRRRIVEFAARQALPAMYPFSEFMDDGGLVFYGPDFPDMFRRSATYVDKILKGAKPAELPIEQPAKFELVVNAKTAKVLGVTVPESVLLQATRVID